MAEARAPASFRADTFAGPDADRRVHGVNIALFWPFPAAWRVDHARFVQTLSPFDRDLYLYPYETTHVTVLTGVSFKQRADPSPEAVDAIDAAAASLGDFLVEAARTIPSFRLDVGRPVLAEAAGYLPIDDPTGAIARLRAQALAFCRESGGQLAEATAPGVVHSTILRFRGVPRDPVAVTAAFSAASRAFTPQSALVSELLVTLETKPYMRAGQIVTRVQLSQ